MGVECLFGGESSTTGAEGSSPSFWAAVTVVSPMRVVGPRSMKMERVGMLLAAPNGACVCAGRVEECGEGEGGVVGRSRVLGAAKIEDLALS